MCRNWCKKRFNWIDHIDIDSSNKSPCKIILWFRKNLEFSFPCILQKPLCIFFQKKTSELYYSIYLYKNRLKSQSTIRALKKPSKFKLYTIWFSIFDIILGQIGFVSDVYLELNWTVWFCCYDSGGRQLSIK